MKFINAVQPDVKDRSGTPRETRTLLGEPSICLGGFELIRDGTSRDREYSPLALAEHLERLERWPGLVEIDAEWDKNDPELWQTSLTHPATVPEALTRTMRTVVDLSVVYSAWRPGPAPFWYLLGASPYYKNLGNANARALHTQDQLHFAGIGIEVECERMSLDAYRGGHSWEDRWQPDIIAAMIRVNREIWPEHPITISLCCRTTDNRKSLTVTQLKADLDACRKLLAQDGHADNAIELWEGVHEAPATATSLPYVDLWNSYVREHGAATPSASPQGERSAQAQV